MEQLVLHVFLLLTSNSKKGNPAPELTSSETLTRHSSRMAFCDKVNENWVLWLLVRMQLNMSKMSFQFKTKFSLFLKLQSLYEISACQDLNFLFMEK